MLIHWNLGEPLKTHQGKPEPHKRINPIPLTKVDFYLVSSSAQTTTYTVCPFFVCPSIHLDSFQYTVFLGTFTLRNRTRKHSLAVGGISHIYGIGLMIDVVRCIHVQRRRLAEDEIMIDRSFFLCFLRCPK